MSNQKHLQEYGLSEKEAAVYAAALELGPATADQLAKQADVKRSTTYVQIEALQAMGLMSSYEEGKKTLYTPESPENLARLIERQKAELDQRQKELSKDLPDLMRSFESAGERPLVRFYQGKEGIVSVREEMLRVQHKQTHVVFAADRMSTVFTDQERDEYTSRRVQLGIRTKMLYARSAGPFPGEASPLTERKHLEKNQQTGVFSSDIAIFDDKVAFFSFTENIFCAVVQSRSVSESMIAFFDELWVRI